MNDRCSLKTPTCQLLGVGCDANLGMGQVVVDGAELWGLIRQLPPGHSELTPMPFVQFENGANTGTSELMVPL
ncbi:hypothetical protein GBA52_015783 [Prunus armeniaca]|nr:hypothetical protein GBA52_015783 [Prunus armeniaca]